MYIEKKINTEVYTTVYTCVKDIIIYLEMSIWGDLTEESLLSSWMLSIRMMMMMICIRKDTYIQILVHHFFFNFYIFELPWKFCTQSFHLQVENLQRLSHSNIHSMRE